MTDQREHLSQRDAEPAEREDRSRERDRERERPEDREGDAEDRMTIAET